MYCTPASFKIVGSKNVRTLDKVCIAPKYYLKIMETIISKQLLKVGLRKYRRRVLPVLLYTSVADP
jgi:hypothetical protein